MKSDINIRKQSKQTEDNKWQCMDDKCPTLRRKPFQAATFSKKDAAENHHVCVVLEINGTFIQLTTSHIENLSHQEPYHMYTLRL
jgi:hypothetical protein